MENQTLNNLIASFDDLPINYDKFSNKNYKEAYPNYEHFMSIPGTHNVEKWIEALKEIKFLDKEGMSRSEAIKRTTSGWKNMEVFDFLNWVNFYEEGVHLKYKKAQMLPNNTPNYFLKLKEEGSLSNKETDIDFALSEATKSLSRSEKKKIIERQRNKIISRLDSAEKLLRTEEGELFAGNDLESLIQSIYALKTKIQLVNKISISTKLYEDMIIREANIFNKKGFNKASHILNLVANGTDISELSVDPSKADIPNPASADPPTVVSGDVGGLPSKGPGMPQTPGKLGPNINPDVDDMLSPPPTEVVDETAGVQGFLNNLSGGGIVPIEDQSDVDDENILLVSEAQELPEQPQTQQPQQNTKTTEPNKQTTINKNKSKQDVSEFDFSPKKDTENINVDESEDIKTNKIDQMIDSVFNNITVNDVVSKLEDLSKVYNTRELPRQLAIVDMMLDRLGLATYFPTLSEATNKALDSNNYIATRIDDILGKLRGNMGHDMDLSGDDHSQSPEVENVRKSLENQENKEEKRKELRREKEDKALEEAVKEEPEIDLGDLGKEPATPPEQPAQPAQQPAPPKTAPPAPGA